MRSITIEEVLRHAERVAVLTGAGISAEAGIPTFRSKDGIWSKFKPEELANIRAFMANPDLVWRWYQERAAVVCNAMPTRGHIALAELESKVQRVDIITQNIDGLHQRTGSVRVHELHGSLLSHRCLDCGEPYAVQLGETDVPHCPRCGGLIRPGVVWFGEELPKEAWTEAEHAAKNCDVLLTVGTSAVVYPAAQLPFIARDAGAYVIEINPERTDFTPYANLSLRGLAGDELPKLLDIFR